MQQEKTLRSDARRNRERLVAAARDELTEHGAGASLERIAARAGVGIGTLYRRFPTRGALVAAVFEDEVGEWLAAAEAAAARDDAWEGLREYLERTVELQARSRPLHDVFMRHLASQEDTAAVRDEIRRRLDDILARARADGQLRPDFTLADLALLLWSLGPVIEATSRVAPHAARRHLAFALDGLRAAATTQQADPPLTDDELREAHRTLREARA